MEEVRSSIEKIFDSYETSNRLDKSIKKMDYSFLTNSKGDIDELTSPSGPAAKRKRDDNDSSFSYSTISLNSTLNGTSNQWEIRILKADLIEANAKVQQMKKEIDERVRLHSNLEQLYEGRLKNLQNEMERSLDKNKEYEKIVKHFRKKSANEKDEIVKLKNEIARQHQSYNEVISSLKVTNRDLESVNRETLHRCNTEISTLNLRLEESQAQINAMNEELITLRTRNDELNGKLIESDKLTGELDLERYNLNVAQRKIQELETDLVNYGEWKNLSKVFQQRLAKVTELERECERLTRDNKNLHETIGNKLLLEEQVHDLRSRLDTKQQTNENQLDLETKLQSIEHELSDWKKLVSEFCNTKNVSITPHTLRAYIDELQKKHLILTSDAGSANLEKSSVNDQLFELRKQNELLQKTNDNLSTNFLNYKNALHRLQKKLTLIAKERDCFKNLLENYEKDLTISTAHMDHQQDNELKTRLDLVEKSLAGYKEICDTLEKELEMARSTGGDSKVPTINEQNEYLQKELNKLRIENERLNRRKNELELLIEHANMKEAYKIDNNERELKVVHLQINPADEAYENYKNEADKLRAEIERLKRKIRNMEHEHDDLTTRLNETTSASTTVNIQEIAVLRNQIQSLESKQQHYKEIYRAASLEFREVIYLLFGFRVDRIGNNNYRISSVYADNEDEYLNFRLNEMGELDMLETAYSVTLEEIIKNYLVKHHSMPAFLSSLTLELFNRTTVAVN